MLSEASEDMYMLSVCRTKQQEEASKSIHAFNTYQEAVPSLPDWALPSPEFSVSCRRIWYLYIAKLMRPRPQYTLLILVYDPTALAHS